MGFKRFRREICTEDGRRMSKRDYIMLLILLAVYSLFAFINLGSLQAPQTVWSADAGTTVVVDLGLESTVTNVRFYGSIAEGELSVYDESAFIDGFFRPYEAEPLFSYSQDYGDMYKWIPAVNEENPLSVQTRYLILYVESGRISMNEIAVVSGDSILPATVYQPRDGAEKLLDEQDAATLESSALTGMIFDEIYHARTAYEIAQNDNLYHAAGGEVAARDGYDIYEWTHPTLGKLFIALGIRIFGMTPFGWRFAGTFFGVLILAVLYVFGKRIFRRTDYAFITAALFSVDCMHFAQTRIATIDTYALFFTLLMFLFMGDYIAEDFEKRPYWKKLLALGLCGLSFGLGASSKWTCLYSGAGLAVLYFGDLIYNLVRIIARRVREKKELREKEEEYARRLASAEATGNDTVLAALRADPPKDTRKKMPVNVLAYAPVVFVLTVVLLHFAGTWIVRSDYQHLVWDGTKQITETDPAYGVDTINKVFLQPWFYATLISLTVVAIASAIVFRLMLRKRDDVDLTLNNLLMTPVWCCLFFIVIPIVLYVLTNYCYYIEQNSVTLSEKLEVLWRKQVSMYRYHSRLDATHMCQSTWYQWPLAQKSVWFDSGYPIVNGKKWIYNICSTGNPAIWYISAFGAVFAIVEWFKNRACRKDRAFAVVVAGILAGLLPWALVTRCVFLYHYFSTIPFMMLLTLLLLYYAEQKYPKTAWFKWAWLIVSTVVFLMMLPAISCVPAPYAYARFIENVLTPFGKVYYVTIT